MEYKFMGQSMPTDATGVPVSLDAIDPNGNYVHIGDTTSDIYGNFGLAYTPEVPGIYHVIATFAGSKAYYQSAGSTYLTVDDATVTPTEQPVEATLPPTETYFLLSTIAIIVAIAVVGALNILILRKRVQV
jgi:hypothetical protein